MRFYQSAKFWILLIIIIIVIVVSYIVVASTVTPSTNDAYAFDTTKASYSRWMVFANIRESDLARIKIGNRAIVSFRLFPGKVFPANVVAIGHGVSRSEKAPNNYLPYQKKHNNTWVQQVRRFPVQVEVPIKELKNYPLRRGSTATVAIFTGENGFWNGLATFFQWLGSSLKAM